MGIHNFLGEKKFKQVQRNGELIWRKSGFACDHCVKIELRHDEIIISSFIVIGISGAEESSKGFFGGFGKWPLHKIVKQLEKMITERQGEISNITEESSKAVQSILAKMPNDFEDTCDLEGTGFTISAGYYEGYPLAGENESGIVLNEISNLAGRVLSLRQDDGYMLQIQTVESDWISEGAVKIIKQIENSITVSFKFAVPFGLNDVVTGTVELIKDTR